MRDVSLFAGPPTESCQRFHSCSRVGVIFFFFGRTRPRGSNYPPLLLGSCLRALARDLTSTKSSGQTAGANNQPGWQLARKEKRRLRCRSSITARRRRPPLQHSRR
ncbi:hypothetical protein MRX96_000676 [Rhipicephalus microplus]